MVKPWHRWPKGLRQTILTRDHHTCQINGKGCTHKATAIDHIIRPEDGGPWFHPTNLRATCTTCNNRRRHHPSPSRHW